MIRIPKTHRARGLFPYAATIASLSLAATCSVSFYRNDAISIAAARGTPIAPATANFRYCSADTIPMLRREYDGKQR